MAKMYCGDTLVGGCTAVDNVPTEDSTNLINSGGVYEALEALNASDVGAATRICGTLTLPISGWTDSTATSGYYTKSVSVTGILATDVPTVCIAKSLTDSDSDDAMQEAWNVVEAVSGAAGAIVFYAKEVPSVSVSCTWEVVR